MRAAASLHRVLNRYGCGVNAIAPRFGNGAAVVRPPLIRTRLITMNISARNVFEGKVTALSSGPVSAEVEVLTPGGDRLVATITQGSVQALGLAVGKPVIALIKASNVMIMTDAGGVKLSARNCLTGTVEKIVEGPVSAEVILTLAGGAQLSASITREGATALGITPGSAATAVIKASSIIIGVRD